MKGNEMDLLICLIISNGGNEWSVSVELEGRSRTKSRVSSLPLALSHSPSPPPLPPDNHTQTSRFSLNQVLWEGEGGRKSMEGTIFEGSEGGGGNSSMVHPSPFPARSFLKGLIPSPVSPSKTLAIRPIFGQARTFQVKVHTRFCIGWLEMLNKGRSPSFLSSFSSLLSPIASSSLETGWLWVDLTPHPYTISYSSLLITANERTTTYTHTYRTHNCKLIPFFQKKNCRIYNHLLRGLSSRVHC